MIRTTASLTLSLADRLVDLQPTSISLVSDSLAIPMNNIGSIDVNPKIGTNRSVATHN